MTGARTGWPSLEGNHYPLQYSCLENPVDGGAWWATVHRSSKNQTQLRDYHLSVIHELGSSLPGSSVKGFSRQEYWSGCHAIFQGIWLTQVSWLAGGFFTIWATGEFLANFKCSSIGTWLPTDLSIYISSSGNWTYYMTDSKSMEIQGAKWCFWMGPLQWSPWKRGTEEAPPASCQGQRTADTADKMLTLPGRACQSCWE